MNTGYSKITISNILSVVVKTNWSVYILFLKKSNQRFAKRVISLEGKKEFFYSRILTDFITLLF